MAIVLLSRVALWREAFGADGGTQKVMEYEDRIGVTPQGEPVMMLFFMCPGCGIYMGSKMWKVLGENLTSGQRWYCGVNWSEFNRQHPRMFADLLARHGGQQRLEEVVGHHFLKEYPFTIPLILSVEVGTLICVWLYSEEPNTHSPCGSN